MWNSDDCEHGTQTAFKLFIAITHHSNQFLLKEPHTRRQEMVRALTFGMLPSYCEGDAAISLSSVLIA